MELILEFNPNTLTNTFEGWIQENIELHLVLGPQYSCLITIYELNQFAGVWWWVIIVFDPDTELTN